MLRLGLSIAVLAALFSIQSAPPAGAIDVATLYKNNKARVVKIRTIIPGQNPEAGVGVIISPTGHVLTALHVIGGSKDVAGRAITVIRLDDEDRPTPYAGGVHVSNVEPKLDLALLQLSGHYSYAEVSVEPLSGTPPLTAIIWNEGDSLPLPSSGTLNVPDPGNFGDRLTLALSVIPSNSGGPVFDESGKVVAIVTNKKSEHDPRFSLAAPLSSSRAFLPLLSPEERQTCINKLRAVMSKPKPFEVTGEVKCDGKDQKRSKPVQYLAPEGYTIAGVASHEDDTNEYGWVGAPEYVLDQDGRVASAGVELNCMTANQAFGPLGWAKTKLYGSYRKILTANDQADIQKKCITH
jgi:hypothetical protein